VSLVQGRRKVTFLPAFTDVLLHHNAMDTWTVCSVVSTGPGGEISVVRSVTTVLLHHRVMDTWTVCSVVSTGQRGNYCCPCRD